MTLAPIPHLASSPLPPPPDREGGLRTVARELEARFLAEMLKHAGVGEGRDSFGGGAGEAQFASMLRLEQARALADRGGVGFAEALFRALASREAAASERSG